MQKNIKNIQRLCKENRSGVGKWQLWGAREKMKEYYDVIIVGTGAAGFYCALNLPERKNILMITKKEADQSDSFLAQGGICMLRGEDDYEDYFEDTVQGQNI